MSGNAETPSYTPPAKKPNKHSTSGGTANAQTGHVDIRGPESHEVNSDVVTRAAGHAAGLAARDGDFRRQESAVGSGHKIPHKLAHAQAGGRDSRKNQSAQNDAKVKRNLSRGK
jgi:hypothetical protein